MCLMQDEMEDCIGKSNNLLMVRIFLKRQHQTICGVNDQRAGYLDNNSIWDLLNHFIFINLLLTYQEMHCVEERYVRTWKKIMLGLIELGTPKNIHGREHPWQRNSMAENIHGREYPWKRTSMAEKQLASEDLAPDHQAARRRGRTENESGAWKIFGAEAIYKYYKRTESLYQCSLLESDPC